MNTGMLQNLRRLVGFICTIGCVVPIASVASASTYHTWEFTYPGTACNTFGQASMGPSGGADLVNWSNNKLVVECPIVREASTSYLEEDTYVDIRGSVTCYVRAVDPANGSGWAFSSDLATFPTGYTEYYFGGHNISLAHPYGASLECFLAPGAVINNYRVQNPYLDR
jgi:hypothetical protein